MPFYSPEVVEKAKQMDLYTYLKNYKPEELVHLGGSSYCTKEHDSLKISNGMWYWFSRSIGGRSALDYLIKVEGMAFTEAVEEIVTQCTERPTMVIPQKEPQRSLLIPEPSPTSDRARSYLIGRGIDPELGEKQQHQIDQAFRQHVLKLLCSPYPQESSRYAFSIGVFIP